MPKNFGRGRKNNNRRTERFVEEAVGSNDRNFYAHDTRESSGRESSGRHFQGNVKSGRIDRHRSRPGPLAPERLQRIVEQDIDMAGTSAQADNYRRNTPYSRSGGKKSYSAGSKQQPASSASRSSWSKVTIPFGKKYEKDFILLTLLNASKTPFIPIYYHLEGNNAVFYVEETAPAESLSSLNKQITLEDGFKLIVLVKWSPPPRVPLDAEVREKIKLVMSRRYDVNTKVLNLSQFHLDEELCVNYYTPLSRENVMQAVVSIIGDNIPDVVAIDASNNKIYSIDQMKSLITKTTSLRSLNLGSNKLTHITALDPLQGLPLEELILNQNPLCDRFNDQSGYISAVRKRFSKLVKLDGVDLPPVISFDVGAEDVTLPKSQGSWFVATEARQIALAFLEQYLSVYDSDDRQPLLNAYHDSALMSMTCSYPPGQPASSIARLDAYMKENRNLKRIDDTQRRLRMLQQGKVDVVSFLSKLPKTLHDPQSLVVDVPVTSSHLIVASVTGLFRERNERHPMTRWFQRIFIIVPNLSGFCIVNEQLHICNATTEQRKAAFKGDAKPTPAPVSVPAPVISTVPPVVATAEVAPGNAQVDPVIRQQMIMSFSEQSGMNIDWSSKCLEENGWNFDHAAYVFTELKKANQIPPEAFIK